MAVYPKKSEIIKTRTHLESNCRLILCHVDNCYIVGWTGGAVNSGIVDAYQYPSRKKANEEFEILWETGPDGRCLMRDWQQKRLYDWEDKFVGIDRDLTEQEIVDIAYEIFAYVLEINPAAVMPEINFNVKSESSFYRSKNHSVNLTAAGQALDVLIHELAHAWEPTADIGPGHSPAFVYLLIHLYAEFMGKDARTLLNGAKDFGLVVAEYF